MENNHSYRLHNSQGSHFSKIKFTTAMNLHLKSRLEKAEFNSSIKYPAS